MSGSPGRAAEAEAVLIPGRVVRGSRGRVLPDVLAGVEVLGEEAGDVAEGFLGRPGERGFGVAEHGREVAVLSSGQHVAGALDPVLEQGGVQEQGLAGGYYVVGAAVEVHER